MYHTQNQHFIKSALFCIAGLFLLFGCSTSKRSIAKKSFEGPLFQNSFHGMVVMDAKTGNILHDSHGAQYFTPASNTKIATLYAGLTLLPDHFPTLKYVQQDNNTIILPTGDPTWLHPFFKDSTGILFLKQQENISLFLQDFRADRFGPGWAWEDYPYYFSPERNALPLYGNVASISNIDGLEVSPLYFLDQVEVKESPSARDEFQNRFYIDPKQQDTIEVPFITEAKLTKKLLESILKKEISLLENPPHQPKEVLYGIKSDSIYKRMMHISDNFLAEQIMVTASSTLSDTLSVSKAIGHMLENELDFLEHPPRWVDGSGLSRYNLFTPKSFAQILYAMYRDVDSERLFNIFPNWDASGTIAKWENPNRAPFIFAKSGSLGNNYNLSGYLKAKSGRVLIFSFMNNHFKVPSSKVRAEIYRVLTVLWEQY